MNRYAKITRKIPREIVLLRSLPCEWGRCSFCDYIEDNTTDEAAIRRVADQELAKVTGEFGRLEVINSGSIQELPQPVREQIRDLIAAKGIEEFICESHWAYRGAFDETRAFFGVPTRIKVGVETFNDRLRNEVLDKGMYFASPDEVARVTDTICLMVGFRGQTHDTVRRDVDILIGQFNYGCINLFTENTRSAHLVDRDIKAWFAQEYRFLDDLPNVEVLWKNSDFGVG